MDYILDTHVLLWFLQDDEKLSETALNIILDKNSEKYVSMASLWEISIKNRIGKLPIKDGLINFFDEVEANGFGLLSIDRRCIEIYNKLPLIHRDPFDGMIVGTAIFKNMTIITADENIQKYNVNWVY